MLDDFNWCIKVKKTTPTIEDVCMCAFDDGDDEINILIQL